MKSSISTMILLLMFGVIVILLAFIVFQNSQIQIMQSSGVVSTIAPTPHNDNPSGQPEKSKSFEIPVLFSPNP